MLIASIISFAPGPGVSGCACDPYAYADDAASCLDAPAGLVRIIGTEYTVYAVASDEDNNGLYAAVATELGSVHCGAGLGWTRSGSDSDTLDISVSIAETLRGDPVGFMEGVFGPSISVGASLGFASTDEIESMNMLSASLGIQFSVFPTVAIGASVSDLRLFGDNLREREIGYGFSTVFHRGFRGHFSVSGSKPSFGFDLSINDWLSARTGSDGSSWNAGLSAYYNCFRVDWAVMLDNHDNRQTLGVSFSPGGFR